MNYHDLNSLRLLTREHHNQRLREADAERLLREMRGTPHKRPRPRLTACVSLKPRRRAVRPHFEA